MKKLTQTTALLLAVLIGLLSASVSADYDKLTIEEAVSYAHLIVDAEYVGSLNPYTDDTIISNQNYEMIFKPTVGYLGDWDGELIYVMSSDEMGIVDSKFAEGETYFMILEKHESVYYDHPRYFFLLDEIISSSDENWQELHDQTKNAVRTVKSKAGDTGAGMFTASEELSEIIEFATDIYIVRVDAAGFESPFQPTTSYNCTVTRAIKGKPNHNGDIQITIFNDTVEIGKEYLVMLYKLSDTSIIYPLAAKNAVFALDAAEKIPELAELLASHDEFTVGKATQGSKNDFD